MEAGIFKIPPKRGFIQTVQKLFLQHKQNLHGIILYLGKLLIHSFAHMNFKKSFKGILVFLCLVITMAGYGSVSPIDSLLAAARNALFSSPDSAHQMILEAISLSGRQKNYLMLADSYRLLGNYHSDILGDPEKASAAYARADSLYRKSEGIKAIEGIGAISHCYGTLNHRQGNYVDALSCYTRAIAVLDSVGNKTILPKTLNNISTLYAFLEDYPKAEKYARECLNLANDNQDEYLASVSSITLADARIAMGAFSEVPELLENARLIATRRKDLYILDLYHVNYGNYCRFFKKNIPEAIEHYQLALMYADSLGSPWEQVRSLTNLSELYYLDQQLAEAEETGLGALALSEKLGTLDIRQRVLSLLSKIRAHHLDFAKAYAYLEESFQLRDSVLNEKKQRDIELLESIYQTEKKELKIASLEKEKRLQMIIASAGIIALILLIISLYLRQLSISNKKKLAEQEIIRLEQEKQLVATQAVLEGETTERSRLARDLHDGLGGLLTSMKLSLSAMKERIFLDETGRKMFVNALDLLDMSVKELHQVANNMMPESLLNYGLKTAIENFVSNLEVQDCDLQFRYYGSEIRFMSDFEMAVYRMAQELYNNALKHADAEEIFLQIVVDGIRFNISYEDNGKGFDIRCLDAGKGMGLQNLSSRVKAFGGQIEISSAPNQGTQVTIEFKDTSKFMLNDTSTDR